MDWESARKRWYNCVENDGARVNVFVFVFVVLFCFVCN